MGGHANPRSGWLNPVNPGNPMVRQQATPASVCEDHQFGNDPIERGVTAALHDSDRLSAIGFAINIERKVDPITRFGFAAQLIAFRAE